MTICSMSALPYHMVRQVAKYVCQPKSELDMEYIDDEPVNPLVALLHVCHDWRQVTLPMMFGLGYIRIPGIESKASASYHKSILNCIDESYNVYMVKLTIGVNIEETVLGESLSILKASKVGDFVFPNLSHVSIVISYRQKTLVECPNANNNIRKLVQHICRMIPALNSIELAYMDVHKSIRICVDTLQQTNNLADELYKTMSVIYYIHNILLGSGTKCSLLNISLTSLSMTWITSYNLIYNLIYTNSQSLQKLNILLSASEGFEKLVHRHGSQEYMCYPRLAELTITGRKFMSGNVVPPTGNAVVFPRLCKVDICFEYPFSDDVLFRGNRWTLESVELVLSTEAMMQLSSDGVFNKSKMIALQNVIIRSRDGTTNDATLNSCSKNFFQGLLSSTHYLTLQAQSYYDILIGSIDSKTQHHNLKYLHLGCSNVSLESIVVLLQALPRLSYLKSAISSLGATYSEMTLSSMLKHMQLSFNPLSKSFHTWSIYSLDTVSVGLVSTCIILLIDQCPNLQTLVFNDVDCTTPMNIQQRLVRINTGIYKQNARTNENLEFKITFAPDKAVVKIIRSIW